MEMDEIKAERATEVLVDPVDEDNELTLTVHDVSTGEYLAAFLTMDQTLELIEVLRSRLPIEVRP